MTGFMLMLCSSLMSFVFDGHQAAPQLILWQADLQIQSLTISEARGQLTARVVIETDLGEALATRVEVLLPVGVGIVTLGSGCVAGPSVTGIRELRGRVECRLGNLPARSRRELFVVTTAPPTGVARGFAAVVMSETPDPRPANNFLERVIPPDEQQEPI